MLDLVQLGLYKFSKHFIFDVNKSLDRIVWTENKLYKINVFVSMTSLTVAPWYYKD